MQLSSLKNISPIEPDIEKRNEELQQLLKLSDIRKQRESNPQGSWELVKGSHFLFSAPHEVKHIRDGEPKIAEKGTAALAVALANYVGGSAICTTGVQRGDPNWDLDTAYLGKAHELAQNGTIIDLHMMRPRGVEVCIGLGPIPNLSNGLWNIIIEEAVLAGLRVSINWPFSANVRTVTAQSQRKGFRAIQIELSWHCFNASHPAMEKAWSALARAAVRM